MIETAAPLQEWYATALRRYVAAPDEAGRAEAYEVGRAAMADGWGVLALAQAHSAAIGLPASPEEARLTAEFFGQALGPYEMALRGFRDANAGLRNLNRTLEQRIAERTAALEQSDSSLRGKTQV
ncbi:MAG: hypothetical protein H0V89_05255, partial [Deltaproteobacteria bacterium]|nr:hypothetical protein [Deltaproteobacteria bacterium]